MSHFVSINDRMQCKSILSIPCRQIVVPKYRSLLKQKQICSNSCSTNVKIKRSSKCNIQDTRAFQQECREQLVLKSLCEKLAQKQLRKIQLQNQVNLRKKFNKIKQRLKMNNSELSRSKGSEVIKYFQGKDDEPNLSTLLRQKNSNIEIGKKYQSKITNKLVSIKQAVEIQETKQKYNHWFDTYHNSPLKSPNYSKMNFVIEKVSKKRNLNQLFNINFKQNVQTKTDKNTSFNTLNQKQNKQKLKRLSTVIEDFRCYRGSDKTGYNPSISVNRLGGQYQRKIKQYKSLKYQDSFK